MPSVQIQDVTPRDQYTAGALQTVFIYSFTLFNESDLEVYKRADEDTEANDYTQKLQRNIDYTIDLTANTITMLVACAGGEIVTLVRNMPDERLNLYTNGSVITADALNTDQESSVLMIQQNKMYNTVLTPHYNKSEIIDDTNPEGGDVILPRLGPGQVWAKDSTDSFIEAVSIGGGGGGDVQMLDPDTTGQFQGSVTRWDDVGILTDSVVIISDTGSLTGATDGTFGDIRIGVTAPGTLDTSPTKDLTITAAAGQSTTIGTLGDTLTLGGLTWPAADGTAGFVLSTDGAGALSFVSGSGGAPFASTKYNLVQFADATGGLQDSGIDYQAGVLSGMTEIDVGNLELSGNSINAGNANGDINLTPNGTGAVISSGNLSVGNGKFLLIQNVANTFSVAFTVGALAKSTSYVLPLTDGTAGQVLSTDGAGNLSWVAGGSGNIPSNIKSLVQNGITHTGSSGPFAPVGPIVLASNTNRVKITMDFILSGNTSGASPIYMRRNGGNITSFPTRTTSLAFIDSPATTAPLTYNLFISQGHSGDLTYSINFIIEEIGPT